MEGWHKSDTRRDYYWRDADNETWRVKKDVDGWYWRVTAKGSSEPLSSEYGPFSSHVAAMADCETAHKHER